MLPRLLLLLALLCLPATAQRKESSTSSSNKDAGEAPAVYPQEVRVLRGQSVVITLRGTSSTMRDMTFKIREPGPQLGTFKEAGPVSTDKTHATITYIASPDKKGNKDTFTFVGQVPGSSVGDPATVTIHITDTAAKLDFVDTVDVKRLVLNQPVEKTFLLRNGGNAPWEAKIAAPHGWQWVYPPDGSFKLAPGAEIKVRIKCLARNVGPMDDSVDFAPGKRMLFLAKVVPPFTLPNSAVALQWRKEPRGRTGNLEINNLDPANPVTVEVKGPEWLTAVASFTIPPDKKAPLPLTVSTEHGKALTGKVKVTAGTYSEEVEVTAAPSPPVLSIVKGLDDHYGFHFGMLNAVTLHTDKIPFTVENQGGSPATLKIKMPDFFRLETPPPAEGVPLAPGASAEFVLLPPSGIGGTFKGSMSIIGGDDTVMVECSAGVDPATLPQTPGQLAGLILEKERTSRRQPRTPAQQEQSVRDARKGYFPVEGKEDPKLPRVNVVEIAEDTGEEVTFAWDLPPGDGWTFRLLRATVQRFKSPNDPDKVGNYAKVWEYCGDEVKYKIDGRRATAKVSELHPHMPFNFCIQTIAPDGQVSIPGREISYRPYPSDPSHWRLYWHWYTGAGAALIGLGWWLWVKWKQPISAVS